jgi:hypothetical protein
MLRACMAADPQDPEAPALLAETLLVQGTRAALDEALGLFEHSAASAPLRAHAQRLLKQARARALQAGDAGTA